MNTQCVSTRFSVPRDTDGQVLSIEAVGEVSEADRTYVQRKLTSLAVTLPGPPHLRVRLTATGSAAGPRSSVVQANLSIDGWQIARTQVAEAGIRQATYLTAWRLEEQLQRAADPYGVRSWPESPCRHRPEPIWVSPGDRHIVRRKSVQLMRSDPVAAAWAMDTMDYDFHLFVNTETGEDSVVYRVGPTGYRLASLYSATMPATDGCIPWTVNVHPIPTLTLHQAAARLNETDLPFRFFRDAESGRGNALYRRLDGHYALLTPADS
jgi:hypothetical protein